MCVNFIPMPVLMTIESPPGTAFAHCTIQTAWQVVFSSNSKFM